MSARWVLDVPHLLMLVLVKRTYWAQMVHRGFLIRAGEIYRQSCHNSWMGCLDSQLSISCLAKKGYTVSTHSTRSKRSLCWHSYLVRNLARSHRLECYWQHQTQFRIAVLECFEEFLDHRGTSSNRAWLRFHLQLRGPSRWGLLPVWTNWKSRG